MFYISETRQPREGGVWEIKTPATRGIFKFLNL